MYPAHVCVCFSLLLLVLCVGVVWWLDWSTECRIRALRTDVVGRLLAITGTVTRTSEVRPELLYGSFCCNDCQTVTRDVKQNYCFTQVSGLLVLLSLSLSLSELVLYPVLLQCQTLIPCSVLVQARTLACTRVSVCMPPSLNLSRSPFSLLW
jgi:MCM OB domain